MKQDSFDMSPGGKPFTPPPVSKSRKELLELFDKNVAAARTAIARASDADLTKSWSFLNNGVTVFSMPRMAVCAPG